MGLEAVMICVDNSEYARNADYAPSRFDVQSETANLLGGSKTGQNPETGVGLLTMAGERVEVLLTPTTDLGSFIAALAEMTIKGTSDFVRGIQCATLALKHRQNKNQKQKVVCFVGSPIESTEKDLVQMGKSLKKNNVSLDIVSFGEIEQNKEKLEKLLAACNSNDTSHLVEVPVGQRLLSDVVLTSAICMGEGGGGGGGGGAAAGGNFEFGVNPETDPELALALRISMEEERRRQEGASGAPAAEGGAAPPAEGGSAPAAGSNAPPAAAVDIPGFEDMDEELRQALLLSMQENQPAPSTAPPAGKEDHPKDDVKGEPDAKKQKKEENVFDDPDFVKGLLGELPGVDLEDERIKEALNEVSGKKDADKKDGDKKDKKDGDKK